MKKFGFAVVTLLCFLAFWAFPGLASAQQYRWKQPIPTPSEYGARVYGYEQNTGYFVNENGYQLGFSGANLVGSMWSSVFALPGVPNSGYTAVTNLDESTNNINGDSQEYQTILQDFLEAFNIPQDQGTGDYLVSPAYNQTQYGPGSPFSQQSGLQFDVPIYLWVNPPSGYSTPSGVTLTPPPYTYYTIGGSNPNPYPLYVGAAADVGAGYQSDGSAAYWEAYGGTSAWGAQDNGIANMTEEGAVTLYDTYDQGYGQTGVEQDGATTGNVIVSYPFTSELEAIDYSGGTVTATALNPTPYDIMGENWYAYVVAPNNAGSYTGAPTLLTQGTVSIGAQPLGNTTPNQSQFTFSVPASDAGDELIVTLNETLNSNQSVTPEGLPVYYAWGPLSNTQTLADNSPKDQVVPLNVWNVTSQGTAFDPSGTPAAYSDNAQSLILSGSSGRGTQPTLVVTPSSATINVGGTQQYTATYHDGENGGTGQNVTTSASWQSGNAGIATVIVTGSSGGLTTGVAVGTTGISATYDGLTTSGRIQVTQQTFNITVTSVTTGASSGVQPAQYYQATVNFSSTFSVGGTVNVFWYQQDDSGAMNPIGEQQIYIGANGTASDTQSWQFPSVSQNTTVTIMASVDDYITGNSDIPNTPQPFPPNSGVQPNESTYSDNYAQQSVAYQPNIGPPVSGQWASGYAIVPIQKTITEQTTKNYQVTPMGVPVTIQAGPLQTPSEKYRLVPNS